MCICVYMLMRDGERRKKEASKVKQTNKAKQHSTPKAVAFHKKNELPRVGLKPTTLYTLNRALYHTYIHESYAMQGNAKAMLQGKRGLTKVVPPQIHNGLFRHSFSLVTC